MKTVFVFQIRFFVTELRFTRVTRVRSTKMRKSNTAVVGAKVEDRLWVI